MGNNWKLNHIAIIVKDVDEAIEFYQSSGIGVAGRVLTKTLKFYNLGPATLEFMQHVEGNSVQEEYLGDQREGLHHIAFTVDDLDREIAKMAEKGLPVMKERPIRTLVLPRVAGGAGTVHFDTRKVGNFSLQLIQER